MNKSTKFTGTQLRALRVAAQNEANKHQTAAQSVVNERGMVAVEDGNFYSKERQLQMYHEGIADTLTLLLYGCITSEIVRDLNAAKISYSVSYNNGGV